MICNIVVLFLLTELTFSEKWDEDINHVLPASLTYHSSINEKSLTFFGYINNCTCRENPRKLIECSGKQCKIFPSTIHISVPLFKLKLTSIVTIRRDDLLTIKNIEGMEIESNLKLVKFEPGCFRNMAHLRNLTISSNMNLKLLEAGVFEGLNNLETLILTKNGFKNVIDITVALSVKCVPRIVLLVLTENMLHKIGEQEFSPMNGSSLSELNMLICEIEYLHPNCLAPLKNLSSLRIGQNIFNETIITEFIQRTLELGIPLDLLNLYQSGFRKHCPYGLLEAVGRSNISYINLGGNNFDYIDDNCFPDMPNLGTLDLRNSLIVFISDNAFRKLTNLTILLLDENKLTEVPIGALVPNLTILGFGGNSKSEYWQSYFIVPDGIFQNLIVLDDLQLPYNNIGYLTNNTFLGLKNLTRLNLRNTSLVSIETGAFAHLENLNRLNIMNNPFPSTMHLTADLFRGLNKLNVLTMGSCSIRNLTTKPSLFYYIKNLTYLSLNGNGLHVIAPDQLSHLKNLHKLHLGENSLTPWNKPLFAHGSLRYLVASQNKFTHITPAMLEDWKAVTTLLLEGNPFTCDCSLFPVVYWLRYNTLSIKYNYDDDFIAHCVAPEPWRRKSIALFINNLTADSSKCENFFILHKALFISAALTLLILIAVLIILGYVYRWYLRYWLFLSRISFHKHNTWFKRKNKLATSCIAYEYDAFVSYSNEDHDFVMNLVEMMETKEPYLKLCVYERDFQMGSLISDSILHNVAVSKRTLLVLSNGFAKSQWCRWEMQLAEYHQLFFHNDSDDGPDDSLLMIKVEDINKSNITPTLKYLMKTRIYLQWDPNPQKQILFWEKLRTTLSAPKGKVYQETI